MENSYESGFAFVLEGATAVSYTHLDVYKRQQKRSCSCTSFCANYRCFNYTTWQGRFAIVSCTPVSYTHLDVYKRQTWICAAAGTDNIPTIKDVMYSLTCDADIMTKITEDTQDLSLIHI